MLLLLCLCVVCLNVFVCLFVVVLCDVVKYVVCDVLFVFLCLCGVCVIECAVVYGMLLVTVCARVDLKQPNVFLWFVWALSCDDVCFCFVALPCVCVGLVFDVFVRCL